MQFGVLMNAAHDTCHTNTIVINNHNDIDNHNTNNNHTNNINIHYHNNNNTSTTNETHTGTNTYLISPPQDEKASESNSLPAILIDAAEGVTEHLDALRRILRGDDAACGLGVKRHVTDVILSHWHMDHTKGLPSLLSTLRESTPDGPTPRVHKYTNAEEDSAIQSEIQLPLETFTSPTQTFKLPHSTLVAHHTPGHTSDHLSFLLSEEGTFFSGDNVLGQGTSVFEDLSVYMSSLERSAQIIESDHTARERNTIFPAHGPVIEGKAVQTIRTYISHRLEREEQVWRFLSDKGPSSVRQIVEVLYAEYPPFLHPAAARGIYLHLHKLYHDARVSVPSEPTLPFDFEKHMDVVWNVREGTKAKV